MHQFAEGEWIRGGHAEKDGLPAARCGVDAVEFAARHRLGHRSGAGRRRGGRGRGTLQVGGTSEQLLLLLTRLCGLLLLRLLLLLLLGFVRRLHRATRRVRVLRVGLRKAMRERIHVRDEMLVTRPGAMYKPAENSKVHAALFSVQHVLNREGEGEERT